jgi:hypothetical protein
MKAFLKKKWGSNYAGQTLTGVEKGSIPSDVADFYGDDEAAPGDVVKDDTPAGGDPLQVLNDAIDPKAAKQVAADKQDIVDRARSARNEPSRQAAVEQFEAELGQKHAREADQFAAKQLKGVKDGAALSSEQKERAEAGKGHGVK